MYKWCSRQLDIEYRYKYMYVFVGPCMHVSSMNDMADEFTIYWHDFCYVEYPWFYICTFSQHFWQQWWKYFTYFFTSNVTGLHAQPKWCEFYISHNFTYFFTVFDDVKRRTSFHIIFTLLFHIVFHIMGVKMYVKNFTYTSHMFHMHFTPCLPVVLLRINKALELSWDDICREIVHCIVDEILEIVKPIKFVQSIKDT